MKKCTSFDVLVIQLKLSNVIKYFFTVILRIIIQDRNQGTTIDEKRKVRHLSYFSVDHSH